MTMSTLSTRNISRTMMLIVIIMLAVSAYAWVQLPAGELVPTHWNIEGEVDGYGSKATALLMMPLVTVFSGALLLIVPKIDPRADNIQRSGRAYGVMAIGTLLFLAIMHVMLVLNILGMNIDVTRIVFVLVGLLFAVLGNYMGKIRQNYMFGIKTPWTLSSELSWNKTHRITGYMWVVSGIIIALAALIGQPIVGFTVMMVVALGGVVFSFGYSYIVWKNDPAMQNSKKGTSV